MLHNPVSAVGIFFAYVLAILVGYLFGSFPTGKIFGKLFKIDVLNKGSKNPGATNIARLSKVSYGVIVALIDIGKIILGGYIGSLIILTIYFALINQNKLLTTEIHANRAILIAIYVTPVLGVIGHCFPIFNKFKNGGKGVASFAGLCFFFSPWLGLVFVILWWIIALATKYISLASIISVVIVPFWILVPRVFNYFWFNYFPFGQDNLVSATYVFAGVLFFFMMLCSALIVFRHRTNLKRLKNGVESKFHFWKSKAAKTNKNPTPQVLN